ncbi:hypothetical protein ILUMI_24459 [Ignelater luminosus]|uniref:Uncharacterized protein n=1 Tax=Ignelater luminosus TaxID=2038154 RepID=A0A8K0CAF6_IGNLU|nr:hypothetical protein ILUMI_24459 [Ignelater luminosus]
MANAPLNSEFNIRFFKPKKDQCKICTAYEQGSETIKHKIKQKYDSHINNNEVVRSLKDLNKDLAMNDKTVCVACFDLQKCLSPRSINLKKSRRTITEDLPKLLPIESKKLKGLLELCHNNDIPEIYHNFYFSLKSKESIGATNFEAEENTTDSDENFSDCE